MEKLLEIKGVSFIYHSPDTETLALDGVTFDVEREEFVAIIGPSGSGKSTILSLLAGLLTPTSGTISLNGKPINESKNMTALMPQRDQLFEWRTILKNAYLGLEIQKTKNKKTMAYAVQLLEKYGLGEFMKKRPSQLSGGMRQRAALIRTLVTSPELLLLDEPFSALDFQTRLNVCNDVYSIIKQEKKTVILVTHDISEAISMADKIIVLTERPGQIKAIYDIDLNKDNTPLQRREEIKFSNYFNKLWADLEVQNDE